MASIYSQGGTSESSYFMELRRNVDRDFNKNVRRAGEDFGFSQSKLDFGIGDLREDVGVAKVRAKEDFVFKGEDINAILARVAQNTFRRYVKKAPNQPTQIGLQNLATKSAQIDKGRSDFLNQRSFDRSIFDLDKTLGRGERDYGLDSKINRTGRDRRVEDAGDVKHDQLLDLNYNITNRLTELSKNATSLSATNSFFGNERNRTNASNFLYNFQF